MTTQRRILIGDLDGTVALNDHRQHWLEEERHPELTGDERWTKFFLDCPHDQPNRPVINLAKHLMVTRYCSEFHIFSGRSRLVETPTKLWLARYEIDYNVLRMREIDDRREDEIVKAEWLREYNLSEIELVLDDRSKVVAMWRSYGLTCLQVAPGNF